MAKIKAEWIRPEALDCRFQDIIDTMQAAIDEARKLAEAWRDYCQQHCQIHWATDNSVEEPMDGFPWEEDDE